MTFERNPHFWNQEQIHLDAIHVPYITSDATASLNFFKDSKISMTGLQAENLTEAMRMGWQIRQHRDGTVFYIDFNFREGRATNNLNLRRAIQAGTGHGRDGLQGDQAAGLRTRGIAVSRLVDG